MADTYHCETCVRSFSATDLREIEVPRLERRIKACPICGRNVRLEGQGTEASSLAFFHLLVRAPLYPFQRAAVLPLVGLTIMITLLGWLPVFGPLLANGLFMGYMFAVIRKSGYGDAEAPATEDFTDWFDVLRPWITFMITVALSLLPLLLVYLRFDWPPKRGSLPTILYGAASLFPLIYLPGAIAVIAHSSSWLAPFFPLRVFRVMARIPGPYLITVILCLALSVVQVILLGLFEVVAVLFPIPVLTTLVTTALSLYLPLVLARIVGIMVWELRRE